MSSINDLAAVLKEAPGAIFIQTHDVPDPDAIASAFGLRYLLTRFGVESRIVYDREFEKIDARRMVELLGVEMSLASDVASLDVEDWIVIVDGQKGNANIVDLGCVGVAVIDHHERCDAEVGSSAYRYSDIRPNNGSCSSMIAEYFLEAGEVPPRLVATALVYGIFIDTDNLTRGVSDLDAEMFWRLHSFADADLIRKLRGSQITLRDLACYAEAFRTVEAYGRIGFLRLEGADDSLVGAANDIVLSVDEVDASIAFSIRPDGVKVSVRSRIDEVQADELARAVVMDIGFGGGHSHMAGGFIPIDRLPKGKSIETLIKHRAISYIEGQCG